ncbi:MAG: hypothetical protein JO360_09195, partial [Acidobacteria bacterium]|nr:hypothetical protein [Acidobacteriota bacterium]
ADKSPDAETKANADDNEGGDMQSELYPPLVRSIGLFDFEARSPLGGLFSRHD